MARYRKDQIERALKQVSFGQMVRELLSQGYTRNLVGTVLLDRGKGVSISVTHIDTTERELHNFTIPEFVEMLGRIKEARAQKFPQNIRELDRDYETFRKIVMPETETDGADT